METRDGALCHGSCRHLMFQFFSLNFFFLKNPFHARIFLYCLIALNVVAILLMRHFRILDSTRQITS
jgi:hypothetical protein